MRYVIEFFLTPREREMCSYLFQDGVSTIICRLLPVLLPRDRRWRISELLLQGHEPWHPFVLICEPTSVLTHSPLHTQKAYCIQNLSHKETHHRTIRHRSTLLKNVH